MQHLGRADACAALACGEDDDVSGFGSGSDSSTAAFELLDSAGKEEYTACQFRHDISNDYIEMCFRLVRAGARARIGLERSYRGRPVGFRIHALVCTAASRLMLVTVYEHLWFSGGSARTVLDPTRMSQGIMTGIGFLGAGVIVKEGLSVRGLTTAASIWMTASIGILTGIGFYFPAGIATALTLGTLSLFRWIEGKMPSEYYANFVVRFPREKSCPSPAARDDHGAGFDVANLSYRASPAGGGSLNTKWCCVPCMPRTRRSLSARLAAEPSVTEFRIVPAGLRLAGQFREPPSGIRPRARCLPPSRIAHTTSDCRGACRPRRTPCSPRCDKPARHPSRPGHCPGRPSRLRIPPAATALEKRTPSPAGRGRRASRTPSPGSPPTCRPSMPGELP